MKRAVSLSRRAIRGGFTLTDLTACVALAIALGSLLAGCMGPIREAERRMNCVNNLKRLALGAQGFADANNGKLPPAAKALIDGNAIYKRVSGFYEMTPFIEMASVKTAVENDDRKADFNSDSPAQSYFATSNGSVLICPAETAQVAAGGSYRQCLGDYPIHASNMTGELSGSLGETEEDICDVKRGAFANEEGVSFSKIIDGSSNTILYSEKRICSNPNDIREGIATSGSELPAAYLNTVVDTTSASVKPVDGTLKLANGETYADGAAPFAGSGKRWMDGAPVYAGFTTILPPNAPSAIATSDDASGGIISPSSYHPGGVFVAFADGSVRWINENIDYVGSNGGDEYPNGYNALVSKGTSPHGVWGALGTIGGQEALPSDALGNSL